MVGLPGARFGTPSIVKLGVLPTERRRRLLGGSEVTISNFLTNKVYGVGSGEEFSYKEIVADLLWLFF